jgi:hypothetical protein
MSLAKYSIGTKIFGAFVAMSMIIAVLGLGGYIVLSDAGDMAVTTFDGPLQAISYAGKAQSDFLNLQMAELQFEQAAPEQRAGIAAQIDDLSANFSDDLSASFTRSRPWWPTGTRRASAATSRAWKSSTPRWTTNSTC